MIQETTEPKKQNMMQGMRKRLLTIGLLSLLSFGIAQDLLADGNETLGPPVGLVLVPGTGIAAHGVGLVTGSGILNINVPSNAVVKQVILYWNVFSKPPLGSTDTITLNGTAYTGTRIGGPENVDAFVNIVTWSNTYRADLTSFNLVSPGANSFNITNSPNNGAGMVVIYDDFSQVAVAPMIRDGQDYAYKCDPIHPGMKPQTFTFGPLTAPKTAHLNMFFGSVTGPASGAGNPRPTIVDIFVDGVLTQHLVNQLGSSDGSEWDTLTIDIPLSVGASSIKVQPQTEDATDAHPCINDPLFSGVLKAPPASFVWIGAGLNFTSRANVCGLTWGYWKNHTWPTNTLILGSQTYNATELKNLLKQPVSGDASINLAHQLIAAKFNVLNGTDVSTANGAITAADNLLKLYTGKLALNVPSSSTVGQQFVTVAGKLDFFNSDGAAQPGCR